MDQYLRMNSAPKEQWYGYDCCSGCGLSYGIGCYSEVVVVSRATPMVAGRSAWVESIKASFSGRAGVLGESSAQTVDAIIAEAG